MVTVYLSSIPAKYPTSFPAARSLDDAEMPIGDGEALWNVNH